MSRFGFVQDNLPLSTATLTLVAMATTQISSIRLAADEFVLGSNFNTTGVLGLGWVFGANASGYGNEYSQQGRDLERTVRNDRLVRFSQAAVLALDPDTGAPFNVVHVDNTADPNFEDGSAETPFSSLLTAQNQSDPGDLIFVNAGDGTDRNQDMGIVLQDDQLLFGAGIPALLPLAGGQNLLLNHDVGTVPTISNSGGFAVVTLADDNDVVSLNIDATGAQFGIFGNGNQASIRSNTVTGATLDGVLYSGTGDVTISDNTFADNGRNGLFLNNQLDQTANISISGNTATGNLLDGIRLFNYDPASLNIANNNTSNNLRHGLNLENNLSSSANPITILNHTSDSNVGSGVVLNRGSGNLNILNSTITNNGASGLVIENWTTADPERILIGTVDGGVGTISGNGSFANLEIILDDPGAQSNVDITGHSFDNGVRGIAARVEGYDPANNLRTTLDLDIVDNVSVSGNLNDGIRLVSLDSALIDANIVNTAGTTPLQIVNNASGGGDGISLLANGVDGQPQAEIRAAIENVFINNDLDLIQITDAPDLLAPTDGIGVDGINNSLVNLEVTDSTIGAPNGTGAAIGGLDTQNGIRINFANTGSQLINRVNIDNVNFFNNIGVSLLTGPQTFTDFTLANSTLRPNGTQSTDGTRADDSPFADGAGFQGVVVNANGQANITGNLNVLLPSNEQASFVETVTDGIEDNLTQVTLLNNSIQDFTFEGVDINTTGDAQLLLTLASNDISNNGAGADNDISNNGTGVDNDATPNQLFFFDAVDINAFDESTISASITGNVFRDNFERGLSLNTFNSATINAVLTNNTFFGNDRGQDANSTSPPVGVGTAAGSTGPISTSGVFSLEAVNNEEFYFRNFETLVFTDQAGMPVMLNGMPLPADTPGVFFPGNTGLDIFGAPVALGTADLNLSLSNNSLQLGADLLDFSVAPGEFTLGLDGLTNGFAGGLPGITDVGTELAEILITNEELFFQTQGF